MKTKEQAKEDKKRLALMLETAQDESTPSEVLTDIWHNTTSAKIRKAIASNPNADTLVLRAAARLYLEEVLENPGFQMIKLFDSDHWITKVSEAYEDPTNFFMKYGKYASLTVTGEVYSRAILISKSLDLSALDACICFGQKASFDKALKNKSTFANIRNLVRESIDSSNSFPSMNMESYLILYKAGVIEDEELFKILSLFGAGSSSARKRICKSFFDLVIKKFSHEKDETKKEFYVKMLSKFICVSRSHVLNWLIQEFSYELMERRIDVMCLVLRELSSPNLIKYHTLLSDHRYKLARFVSDYLRNRFFNTERKAEDIRDIYYFIKDRGLMSIMLQHNSPINMRHDSFIGELNKLSMEIKFFFVKTQCLGDWFAIDNNARFSVVDSVNEYIYEKEGVSDNLLFNSCSMRKIVSLDHSTYAI